MFPLPLLQFQILFMIIGLLEVSVHIAALLELSLEEKIEALRLDIPSSAAAPASDLMTA